MTIHDYIKKRGLTKWRTWPVVSTKFPDEWMPAFFIAPDSGQREHDDKFEIYANADDTTTAPNGSPFAALQFPELNGDGFLARRISIYPSSVSEHSRNSRPGWAVIKS
jgi:hypothetical protein